MHPYTSLGTKIFTFQITPTIEKQQDASHMHSKNCRYFATHINQTFLLPFRSLYSGVEKEVGSHARLPLKYRANY